MSWTYDPAADAAYFTVGPGPVKEGEATIQSELIPTPAGGTVILDFDRDGRLLGVEVLAARVVLRAEVLKQAS